MRAVNDTNVLISGMISTNAAPAAVSDARIGKRFGSLPRAKRMLGIFFSRH